MITTQHTPDCIGTEVEFFLASDQNRNLSSSAFQYLRCNHCGLIRLEKVPPDLESYYPDEYYEVPTLEKLSAIGEADPFKIKTVQRYVTKGRLLDVGPAYGAFALQAKQAGFDVDAIEMDTRCCDYLNQVVGITAICSSSPHKAILASQPYDVITLWHVIEHLPDPWSLIKAAAEKLTPGGILVIAAPNPEAWQFGVMKDEWPHLDAPRHLYLLPEKVLTQYSGTFNLEREHFSTNDTDAKRWNRFGWQKFLMNRVQGKWPKRSLFVLGFIFSILAKPFESKKSNGSAYTLIFRKAAN